MSHCIRKRTLKQALRGGPLQRSSSLQLSCQVFKHFMKPIDFSLERRQRIGPILATDEEGSCITQHAGHMTNELSRRPNSFSSTEGTKTGWRVSEGLLCAIGQRGQKMSEKTSLVIHS